MFVGSHNSWLIASLFSNSVVVLLILCLSDVFGIISTLLFYCRIWIQIFWILRGFLLRLTWFLLTLDYPLVLEGLKVDYLGLFLTMGAFPNLVCLHACFFIFGWMFVVTSPSWWWLLWQPEAAFGVGHGASEVLLPLGSCLSHHACICLCSLLHFGGLVWFVRLGGDWLHGYWVWDYGGHWLDADLHICSVSSSSLVMAHHCCVVILRAQLIGLLWPRPYTLVLLQTLHDRALGWAFLIFDCCYSLLGEDVLPILFWVLGGVYSETLDASLAVCSVLVVSLIWIIVFLGIFVGSWLAIVLCRAYLLVAYV